MVKHSVINILPQLLGSPRPHRLVCPSYSPCVVLVGDTLGRANGNGDFYTEDLVCAEGGHSSPSSILRTSMRCLFSKSEIWPSLMSVFL